MTYILRVFCPLYICLANFFRENPITYDHRGHAMLSASKTKKGSVSMATGGGGSSRGVDLTSNEVMDKLKVLSRFQSVQEFQAFMANVHKEKEVKSRIKDLNRCVLISISKTIL